MKFSPRTTLALAATALLLSSCAAGEGTDDATNGATEGNAPVTIEHIYGQTVVDEVPENISTISWVNADALLALGTVPVGMDKDVFGFNANGSTDWKDAKLQELGAEIGTENAPVQYDVADGVDFSAIAESKPDLIFAAYSGLTQEEYDKLSKIAPTVGPLKENYTAGWEEVTEAAGEVLNKEAEAATLIEDLNDELAIQVEQYPVFKDTTFIAGNLDEPTGAINVYASDDTRPRFMSAIGMTQAPVVAQNTKDGDFFFDWSPERSSELESDIFFTWASSGTTAQKLIESNPLFAQIPAATKGGLVTVDSDMEVLSISAASPLSIPWALEKVVPQFAEAAQAAKGN